MAAATLPRSICDMAVPRFCRLVFVIGLLLSVTMATTVLAAPGRACACGAAIAPGGARATMNHEVALVHWDGATETIVMQLAMDATTDNVALVVPTPAPASVAAADKATFVELDALTAPQVQHKRRWILGIGMVGSAPREGAATAHAPDVVSQVRLGPLEATTLAGGDLAGLQNWLAGNGYAIRPAVAAALDPYVRDGWAFVAIRLTSTAPIVGGLDPVRMTFPAPQLVYPMRLSVAALDPQHVVVYTLSEHRQQRTDADRSRQFTQVQFAGTVAGQVRDPVLRELAGNHGSYLTKTQVDVYQTSQISSDFTFGNAANDDAYRQVVVVYDNVAIPIVVILFVGFLVVVLATAVVLFVVLRRRGLGQRRRNFTM
ncbi:hypothetical protein LAUMK7_00078 [Mycobacterium kansasii]|uniref:DUF2330 domain-containing protein n=4 Tax=Mycobacterium kansasii TaxID=1768 RepID=A0A653EL14_MYCKA|nr:hypothetical protein MKAN_13665 [Mycobacterium kansasii ATCC 12478]KEP39067.1 hypothetical protein MKSMC1_57790 [Mycobacterium kansasii]VAZ63304.1 hypothetical protein LAUMK22_05138 [Mycobacterium kansasii]VAZ64064.1 hypothetical protein LAUMK40_00174 [Mycobacterium kansasii]VAZ70033.1 hypothetical protein LAUMK7_00078 [Mycobacterium kansasii]